MDEATGQEDISRIEVQVHILQIQRFQHEWLQGRVGNVVKLLGNLLPNKTIGGWWVSDMPDNRAGKIDLDVSLRCDAPIWADATKSCLVLAPTYTQIHIQAPCPLPDHANLCKPSFLTITMT